MQRWINSLGLGPMGIKDLGFYSEFSGEAIEGF